MMFKKQILFLIILVTLCLYNVSSANPISFGVNVTDFGADSKHKTDSTQAFLDAITAIQNRSFDKDGNPNGRGTVFVPGGHYIIKKEITIPKNISIEGPDVMEGAFLDFDDQTYGDAGLLIKHSNSSSIKGLTIDNAYNHGIAILGGSDHSKFCHLSNLKVRGKKW